MPKIPSYFAQLLPESRTPTTGLKSAPIDLLTVPSKALGEMGEAVGKLGQLILAQAQKRNERIKKTATDKLGLEYESEGLKHHTNVTTKQGSEAIDAWDTYTKWKNDFLAKDIDLNQLSDSEPLYRQFKKIGWSDEDKTDFKIKRQAYFENLDARLAPHIVKAENMVFFYEGNQNTTLQRENAVEGVKTLEQSRQSIFDYYSTKGKSPEEWMQQYLSDIQKMATTFLDDRFDDGDIVVINDFLAKKYNDYFKFNPNQIDEYRDKAEKAKSRIKVDATVIEIETKYIKDGIVDYDRAIAETWKRKDLTEDERDLARSKLNKKQSDQTQFTIKQKVEEANAVSRLLREKRFGEALRFVRRSKIFDETDKLKYEKELLKNDSPFPKSDHVVEASVKLGILFNPEEFTEDKILSLLNILPQNKGKGLHPDDVEKYVEKRRKQDEEPEKDTPLGKAYKTLQAGKDALLFIKDEIETDSKGNLTPTYKQIIENDRVFNELSEELERRVKKKEDAYKVLEEITADYTKEKAKGILDNFWNFLKGISIPARRTEAIETLKKEGLPVTQENIDIITKREKEIDRAAARGGELPPKAFKMPSNITTTSQAIEWLKKEHKMSDKQAIEWLRSQ